MSVRHILLQYYQPSGLLGTSDVRTELSKDLEKHKQFQGILYFVLLLAVLIVFGLSIWVTIVWIKSPDDYGKLIGALGVSVGAAMEMVRRISREWNRSAMLLILLKSAKEEQVQDLIGKLIDEFSAEK